MQSHKTSRTSKDWSPTNQVGRTFQARPRHTTPSGDIRGRKAPCIFEEYTSEHRLQVLKGSEDDKIREIQQILAQAVLAFTRQPEMDEYVSFVVCLTGTALCLAGAYVPYGYIKPLRTYQQPTQHLRVCRSESYDLMIPHDRMGVAILLLKLLKYLDERKLP